MLAQPHHQQKENTPENGIYFARDIARFITFKVTHRAGVQQGVFPIQQPGYVLEHPVCQEDDSGRCPNAHSPRYSQHGTLSHKSFLHPGPQALLRVTGLPRIDLAALFQARGLSQIQSTLDGIPPNKLGGPVLTLCMI